MIIEYVNDFKETTDDREESVFSKLLKIDSSTAVVMAIDMLIAGIDTVKQNKNFLIFFLYFTRLILYKFRPLHC